MYAKHFCPAVSLIIDHFFHNVYRFSKNKTWMSKKTLLNKQ